MENPSPRSDRSEEKCPSGGKCRLLGKLRALNDKIIYQINVLTIRTCNCNVTYPTVNSDHSLICECKGKEKFKLLKN